MSLTWHRTMLCLNSANEILEHVPWSTLQEVQAQRSNCLQRLLHSLRGLLHEAEAVLLANPQLTLEEVPPLARRVANHLHIVWEIVSVEQHPAVCDALPSMLRTVCRLAGELFMMLSSLKGTHILLKCRRYSAICHWSWCQLSLPMYTWILASTGVSSKGWKMEEARLVGAALILLRILLVSWGKFHVNLMMKGSSIPLLCWILDLYHGAKSSLSPPINLYTP